MPYRPEPDLYWVQISRNSYRALTTVLASHQVRRTNEKLSGPQGVATWQVDDVAVTTISDAQLLLGNTIIEAQLDHLPTHAYRGLVAGSLAFTQYPRLNELHLLFKDPATFPDDLITALEDTIAAGRQTCSTPQLVIKPETFHATWMTERTFVLEQTNGHFLLGLSFDSRYTPAVQAPHNDKVDVGLDLGLFPLTVSYASSGTTKTFCLTELSHIRQLGSSGVLSSRVRPLLKQLLYATGRCDSEKILSTRQFLRGA